MSTQIQETTWASLQMILSGVENPRNTIEQWQTNGFLKHFLPEVDILFGVPQPPEHHPEIDTGLHTMLVMEQAWLLSNRDPDVVFAALLHDLGKGLTQQDRWPKHAGHEKEGLASVASVCQRLEVPEKTARLAMLVCEFHLHSHRAFDMRPGTVIQWLDTTGMLFDDALRQKFLCACEADARGRTGLEQREYLTPFYIDHVAKLTQVQWAIQVAERRLQSSVQAVNVHYAPMSDKDHMRDIIRKEHGLQSDSAMSHGIC